MWIMLNNCFLSIVKKDCPDDSLLVRARRFGDIQSVFGKGTKVVKALDADYLYRAVVKAEEVKKAMARQIDTIDYSNFKNSVDNDPLHDAYLDVWVAMAKLQNPRPYSQPRKKI